MAGSDHDTASRNLNIIAHGDIRIGDLNDITTQLPGGAAQPEHPLPGGAAQLEHLLKSDDFWRVFWPQFWWRLIKTAWGIVLVLSILVGLVAGAITIWNHFGSFNQPVQNRDQSRMDIR